MLKLKEHIVRKKIAQTGFSVKAWAERNGFSQGSLSNWLTGSRNIKHSSLEKLAEALHCDIFDIAQVVIEYTGVGVSELEADREEICGLFGNLSPKQRKAIIDIAELIADANKTLDSADI